MSGIVVIFGGTVEGRLLAEAFQNADLELHLCVATEYGASLLPDSENIHVHIGRMDKEEIEAFLSECGAECCMDATHPYAAQVTKNIAKACAEINLPYVRVERDEGKFDTDADEEIGRVMYQDSVEEAAEFLNHTTGNILITTGSKELDKYTVIKDYQERCFARVLPTASVIERCKELGFEGRNLIGMQGPFSEELNYSMMKQIGAAYLVTKNSGKEGGYQEKCEAALRAGANILVIGRSKEETLDDFHDRKKAIENSSVRENVMSLSEAVQFLKEKYCRAEKRKIYLIGMGPGEEKQLTAQARECLEGCDVIIGAKRMLKLCKNYADKPFYACYQKEEIAAFLKEHTEYCRAAMVYSGDIGFYSGAKGIRELFGEYEVHPVSGISSSVYFLNQLSIPWDEVKLVSCHGKQLNLIPLIKKYKRVCALLGEKDAMIQICETLLKFQMEDIKITIGECLSYPEERILTGTPSTLKNQEVASLSIALFENPVPQKQKVTPGIPDSAFVRGKVPMTKQEIRILSLAKLGLTSDSIVYDIGAGTGSVAVEAALCCENGHVYAIEKNSEGIDLIRENQVRFQAENLTAIEGTAPECLQDLPKPTHVFIGGSSGRLMDMIRAVREKNEEVRFVINAVTLETVAQMEQVKEAFPEYRKMDVIQVNVARGKELGRYHLMTAQNPVYIFSFGGMKR